MSILAIHHHEDSLPALAVPQPRVPISIRQATMDDMPFIDGLQKLHSKAVSFWPRAQVEGYIESGCVLIAESGREGVAEGGQPARPLRCEQCTPLGYVISKDRYFKRDDVGIIYQLNVAPGAHRKLIGVSLVKAVFQRSAYGCKLFSCWCAQDIEANWFWESIGFVPLAFRTGSRDRKRIHIFWQRRIREGDSETPYWYPCQTGAGAIREDRLVFPIPPGTHWSDAKPVILPGASSGEDRCAEEGASGAALSGALQPHPRQRERKRTVASPAGRGAPRKNMLSSNGLRIGAKALAARGIQPPPEPISRRARKAKAAKGKCDPRHTAMARELRDRYLEEVQRDPSLVLSAGKYEISRQLAAAPMNLNHPPLLPRLAA